MRFLHITLKIMLIIHQIENSITLTNKLSLINVITIQDSKEVKELCGLLLEFKCS